jgi:uncharacterized protein (TIGR00255 family)
MIRSMTAFASRRGSHGGLEWDWDLRGVNGRGLELRLRLPDGIEGLEPAVRPALSGRLARGNVTLTLRLSRPAGEGGYGIDEGQLDRVLTALNHVQERAFALGVTLGQPTAADVLSQRGVVVAAAPGEESEEGLLAALLSDLDGLLDDFVAAREAEGRALAAVLAEQVEAIARQTAEAADAAEARRPEAEQAFRASLRRVAEAMEVDEGRLAQEFALLAVKADVTEELDRLRAHVDAARALLADPKPTGRRLDFLAQEFNREANTLLSKAGNATPVPHRP